MGFHEERAKHSLKVIHKSLPLDKMARESTVEKYYRDVVWAYQAFHSAEGAIHMSINPSGVYDPKGYFVQANRVDEYLAPGMRVLELGAGVGFNTESLAKRNPEVSFVASDMHSSQVQRMQRRLSRMQNVATKQLDYRDLQEPAGSFDVVFMVETFCYSTDVESDLKAIQRVLRPGGRLLIFDGWATDLSLQEPWQAASDLARWSMALEESWYIDAFREKAGKEYLIEKEEDWSKDILPCLERLHSLAWRFLRRPRFVPLARRALPLVVQNSVAGMLMPDLFAAGAWTYRGFTLQKRS